MPQNGVFSGSLSVRSQIPLKELFINLLTLECRVLLAVVLVVVVVSLRPGAAAAMPRISMACVLCCWFWAHFALSQKWTELVVGKFNFLFSSPSTWIIQWSTSRCVYADGESHKHKDSRINIVAFAYSTATRRSAAQGHPRKIHISAAILYGTMGS